MAFRVFPPLHPSLILKPFLFWAPTLSAFSLSLNRQK